MFTHRNRFHMERLETRQLMAGDVAASIVNGSLYLNEAAGQLGQDNQILVSQLANGKIRIQGTGAAGTESLINGAAFQDFTVPGSLFVNFGGGKDKVEFTPIGNMVKLQNVYINVGVDSAIGDADKDQVSISNLVTKGVLSITTGASNDTVFIYNSKIGDGVGLDRLYVHTGAGADTLQLRNNTQIRGDFEAQMYRSIGENDADMIFIKDAAFVQKNFVARMGGGADKFLVGDVMAPPDLSNSLQVNGSMLVETGTGADEVSIGAAYIGDVLGEALTLRTGGGADKVTLARVWTYGIEIQTFDSPLEGDADSVLFKDITVFGDLVVDMGGGADKLFFTDPVDVAIGYGAWITGSLLVDMGAGNDWVHIEGTSFGDGLGTDRLEIYTGAGRDVLKLDFSSIPTANGGHLIPEARGDVFIQTYEVATELDRDEVRIPLAQIQGDLNVLTGAGDDFFELLGGNFGNVMIDAGDGIDTGYLGGYVEHEAVVQMGAGDDVLTLGHVNADMLTLAGAGGVDRLTKSQPLAVDYLFESGWEYINGMPTWKSDIVWDFNSGGTLATR
jgi:hypothetical protein